MPFRSGVATRGICLPGLHQRRRTLARLNAIKSDARIRTTARIRRGDLRKHVHVGSLQPVGDKGWERRRGGKGERKRGRQRERKGIRHEETIIRFFCSQANLRDWLQLPELHTRHRRLFMRMQPVVTGRTTARCHLLNVPLARTSRVSCSRTSPAVTSMYVIISRRPCVARIYSSFLHYIAEVDNCISPVIVKTHPGCLRG